MELTLIKKEPKANNDIPAIEIYRTSREPYQVLGIENKYDNGNRNPDCGARWGQFFKGGNHEKIKPLLTETPLLGVFCKSEPGFYNYLIGGMVSGLKEAPEGMFLADFPASEFIVVTHEWSKSIDEAEMNIGRIVGYAHGSELQLPDGYVKCTNPIMFIERYNYEFDKNRFRFEVWLAIKPRE
jgi:predicted transcriptional regulator YdeE